MPKIIKPPEYKQKSILQANINYLCNLTGTSNEALRVSARLSDYQYRERRKDPGKYTYDDLLKIAQKLHTTVLDLITDKSSTR